MRSIAACFINFSEQPVSVMRSFVIQLRTPLPIFDCIRRDQVSWRLTRTPMTMSDLLSSSVRIMAGMSAGSFCRSASRETTNVPRAARQAASSAAVCPLFFSNASTRSVVCFVLPARSTSRLRSVEPSSTATISYDQLPSNAFAISSRRMGMFSSSLYTGKTTERSGIGWSLPCRQKGFHHRDTEVTKRFPLCSLCLCGSKPFELHPECRFEIRGRDRRDFLDGNPPQRRQQLRHFDYVRRLVVASAIRHRREERRVGFDEDAIVRQRFRAGAQRLGGAEGDDAGERNVVAGADELPRDLLRLRERMQNPARAAARQDRDHVLGRLAVVHDDGFVHAFGEIEMPLEYGDLRLARRVHVVIIESALPDRNDARLRRQSFDFRERRVIAILRLMRMKSDRSPDVIMLLRDRDRFRRIVELRPRNYESKI